MKLLWLCNRAPGLVQAQLGKNKKGGLWLDHALTDLLTLPGLEIQILCPGEESRKGQAGERCSYETFEKVSPETVSTRQQKQFEEILSQFQPDVVHIWGTEFGHTLSMLRACEAGGLLERTVVSIQGLISFAARHFNEGVPVSVQKGHTFRDWVRRDNLLHQQAVFARRGENEREALQLCRHVIGRTDWDRACIRQAAPQAEYHFCNETLRPEFYQGSWSYEACQPHRIFASNRMYPLKGFHYALEALAQVLKTYPDAVLAVPGKDPAAGNLKDRLRQDSYVRYLENLTRQLKLQDHVQYLGKLDAEGMKQQYLQANVFVMPSSIENSSNSLGEAMLLGTPCVASHVGGVTTMLDGAAEGFIYQSTAPYMLAHYIETVFSMGSRAELLGGSAQAHARITHDPEKNLQDLLKIYETVSQKG